MNIPTNEKMMHLQISKDDIQGAKYAILPGDPGRVPKIAAFFDNPKQLAYNREYNSWIGELNGEKVLAVSTGIGGPSAAICVEELHMLGVDTFIRVGTCAALQMDIRPGDVIVVTGSIRMEGTSKEYMPIEFPAVPHFETALELYNSAKELGASFHAGVVQCKDSFYGQKTPHRMPVAYELENKWNAWIQGGALGSEMESAALFTVSSAIGAKAGAIMLCTWNQERVNAGMANDTVTDTEMAIKIAVNAVKSLIEKNK